MLDKPQFASVLMEHQRPQSHNSEGMLTLRSLLNTTVGRFLPPVIHHRHVSSHKQSLPACREEHRKALKPSSQLPGRAGLTTTKDFADIYSPDPRETSRRKKHLWGLYTQTASLMLTVLCFFFSSPQVLTIIFMNYRHNIRETQAVINACLLFWLAPSAG